jgi:hypothetical protein
MLRFMATRSVTAHPIWRTSLPVVAMTCVSGHIALAETPPPTASPVPAGTVLPDLTGMLFPWAARVGGLATNWPEGLLYAALGTIGALLTVYLFAGDLLPSMGGRARLALMQIDIDDFRRRRRDALDALTRCASSPTSCDAATVAGWTMLANTSAAEIARIEGTLNSERARLVATGVPLYLILGGFFAAALASTALQALFVGFGWTAIADRAGLKRDQEASKKEKDEAADRFVQTMAAKDQDLTQLRDASQQVQREKQALAAANLRLRRMLAERPK